jgi:hypothetical protein
VHDYRGVAAEARWTSPAASTSPFTSAPSRRTATAFGYLGWKFPANLAEIPDQATQIGA